MIEAGLRPDPVLARLAGVAVMEDITATPAKRIKAYGRIKGSASPRARFLRPSGFVQLRAALDPPSSQNQKTNTGLSEKGLTSDACHCNLFLDEQGFWGEGSKA